jgi:hypothetical protein
MCAFDTNADQEWKENWIKDVDAERMERNMHMKSGERENGSGDTPSLGDE